MLLPLITNLRAEVSRYEQMPEFLEEEAAAGLAPAIHVAILLQKQEGTPTASNPWVFYPISARVDNPIAEEDSFEFLDPNEVFPIPTKDFSPGGAESLVCSNRPRSLLGELLRRSQKCWMKCVVVGKTCGYLIIQSQLRSSCTNSLLADGRPCSSMKVERPSSNVLKSQAVFLPRSQLLSWFVSGHSDSCQSRLWLRRYRSDLGRSRSSEKWVCTRSAVASYASPSRCATARNMMSSHQHSAHKPPRAVILAGAVLRNGGSG